MKLRPRLTAIQSPRLSEKKCSKTAVQVHDFSERQGMTKAEVGMDTGCDYHTNAVDRGSIVRAGCQGDRALPQPARREPPIGYFLATGCRAKLFVLPCHSYHIR